MSNVNHGEVLSDALLEVFGLDASELEEELDLMDIGLLDSLSMMNLIMYLEVKTGRKIDRKDCCMDNFRTVSKIRTFLHEL